MKELRLEGGWSIGPCSPQLCTLAGCVCVCTHVLGRVPLFVILWTVARQAPLSKKTGLGCHFLLQGVFLTQGSNLGLLHCMLIIYHLSHQGSPKKHVKLNTFFDTQKSCTCNKLCQNKNTKTNKTNNTTKKTNQEKESKIYI